MTALLSLSRGLLYRFGQLSTLGLVAILAMAAAPGALTQAEKAGLPSGEAPAAPPVLARPEPIGRIMTLERPLKAYPINSRFGARHLPGEGTPRMHLGVDIAAPEGARVTTAAEGVVTSAGYDTGYGNYVEVRHPNGLRTFYGHLSRIEPGVVAGARLGGGQVIGRVGSTGYSTGPHLHFEVRRRGERLDPALYLGRRWQLEP